MLINDIHYCEHFRSGTFSKNTWKSSTHHFDTSLHQSLISHIPHFASLIYWQIFGGRKGVPPLGEVRDWRSACRKEESLTKWGLTQKDLWYNGKNKKSLKLDCFSKFYDFYIITFWNENIFRKDAEKYINLE